MQALDNAGSDKEELDAKVSLAYEFFDTDKVRSLEYSSEAYVLAKQLGDSAQIVMAGRIKGQMLRRFDRLQESIDILTDILPIAKRNKYDEHYKKILNALALAYTFQANYDKALEYNFQSLVVRENEGDKAEMSIAMNNIGLIYYKLKNYESALKYYNQTLDLKAQVGDELELEKIYINRALCFVHLKKFEEAIQDINKGLSLCGDRCDDQIKIQGKFGLGESSFWLGEIDRAENQFKESLNLALRTNDKRFQAENLIYLGLIDIQKKKYDEAINHLNKADSIASRSGYNQLLVDVYKQFSFVYSQTNDFRNATIYQDKYIRLTDSLFREDLVKNIAKVQTQYEERKNIATIASNEVLIKQQHNLNIAVAVIALLAGLLVLVLQFGNRNIKRVNAKLSEAKEVIQEKNLELANKNKELDYQVEKKTADLARANTSLKQVNDELDNFIYKTSHDIRGPLASLKGMCNVALMDVKDEVALDYLKKLDATAERLNTILTRLVIINQINNSKLSIERIDFKSIVSDVLLLERKKGVPQELLIIPQIDEDVSVESDKELVRIVLENLIDNAIKFYNDSDRVKSFVKIHITTTPNAGAKVRVIDNGIGISESSPGKLFQMFSRLSERSETGGIGLYITKTATEKIGGKVGLLTTPEGYTEFYVIFPPSPYNESERLLRASSF
ncbi:tetratricopeptide repeat-containing sensor histidine kinase [Chryseolinea sp. H1M3-3]|uniref:ATP-binding protein n=1 Tax=Chryseolinea sp. H1M3-3 TaxID=3034144 RepID=UPI0023EAC264|nr:tetratricopeptide repeat-containing sensor histidine kinase [Chryseolinea sp. H1M3-3]